jgi:alpha-tubulin suppressor-like RCC1 family protein
MRLVKTAIQTTLLSCTLVLAVQTIHAKSTGFSSIALGNNSTCVMRTDHSVACFGYGARGQIGDNQFLVHNANPIEVQGYADGNHLSAGELHYCTSTASGLVSCWGDNSNHQVSDMATDKIGYALDRKNIGAVSIASGGHHSCAVLPDGTAKCWGADDFGQLGDNKTIAQAFPVDVSIVNPVDGTSMLLTDIKTVVAGNSHTCAMLNDGSVMCWGYNRDGELGLGDTTDRLSPVGAASLPDIATSIAAGYGHTCAVIANGTLYCWGRNASGQLGTDDLHNRTQPAQVMDDVFPLSGVLSVAVGGSHTCALINDGTVLCWGNNDYGQLGTGNFLSELIPMPVVDETGRTQDHVTAIAAGAIHTCAIIDDSVVKCWGDNTYGELGSGDSGGGMKVAYAMRSKVDATLFLGDFEN